MKIVSWNCNGALRKKREALLHFNADILIIQECEDPAQSNDKTYRDWAKNYLWLGNNKNKGIGIFANQAIQLQPVEQACAPLELFLPCLINGQIPLLATWTRQANSPTFAYIGQLWKYLQRHQDFLAHPQAMLIGDLNSNSRWDVWDRWWNHSDVVQQLKSIGLSSLYHHQNDEAQGQESTPSFFLYRKPERAYHIDYAFLSEGMLPSASITIGNPSIWLELSDHMPLEIRLSP